MTHNFWALDQAILSCVDERGMAGKDAVGGVGGGGWRQLRKENEGAEGW